MITCLRSWKKFNEAHNVNWLISENSTDEETVQLLDKYNIPYFKNKGFRHYQGIDFLLQKCETKYALLIDSDVVFRKNIEPLWNMIKDIDFVIAGERGGDRGGKLLYPRIYPWFCFLNVETIKNKGFSFDNDEGLNIGKQLNERLWDVGSGIYDKVVKAGCIVIDMEQDMAPYFYHYEGMSWRKNIPEYKVFGEAVEQSYRQEIENHKNVRLDADYLTTLGFKYGTDKANHGFLKHYHEAFENIRFDIKSVLEIGVWKGESIAMWLEYFPNAVVSCIDIQDKSHLFRGNNRVKFYQVSQTEFNPNEKFDIIIDDSSHRMIDQQKTFLNLFPKCEKVYILEDLHTSIPPWAYSFGFDGTNSTIDFLKRLSDKEQVNLELVYTRNGESITSLIRNNKWIY